MFGLIIRQLVQKPRSSKSQYWESGVLLWLIARSVSKYKNAAENGDRIIPIWIFSTRGIILIVSHPILFHVIVSSYLIFHLIVSHPMQKVLTWTQPIPNPAPDISYPEYFSIQRLPNRDNLKPKKIIWYFFPEITSKEKIRLCKILFDL